MTGSGPGVEAITFDVDGTLCTYSCDREEILSRAFDRAEIDPFYTATEFYRRLPEYLGRTDSPHVDCLVDLAEKRGRDEDAAREVAEQYGIVCDELDLTATSGVPDVLHELPDDVALGVISNGNRRSQMDKLATLGVTDLFEEIVIAGESIGPKPEAEPFEAAVEGLNADPERTMHVGNSASMDVRGANRFGVRSVWIPDETLPDPNDVTPDHTIDSLSELPELVERER